jgi:hypothetical protein
MHIEELMYKIEMRNTEELWYGDHADFTILRRGCTVFLYRTPDRGLRLRSVIKKKDSTILAVSQSIIKDIVQFVFAHFNQFMMVYDHFNSYDKFPGEEIIEPR